MTMARAGSGIRDPQRFMVVVVPVTAMMATFQTRSPENQGRVRQGLIRWLAPGIFILTFSIYAYCANPAITIAQVASAIAVSGGSGVYTGSFGTNLNALGLGLPAAGVSMFSTPTTPPITGTFYYSPIDVTVANVGSGTLTAYASTNFSHPTAFVGYMCTASSCPSSASYTPLPLTSTPGTTIVTGTPGGTFEVWLGVFVATANGSGTTGGWSGADSITVTFTVNDSSPPRKSAMSTFTLNLTAQTAVGLWLSTATGGLGVSTASDFAMNFSNVNGLGISPAAGLATTSVSGGYVYYTPYTITPVFSGFNTVSTNGTVTVQLGTAYLNPTIIYLEDSASSGGPYNKITGTAITISGTAASNMGFTRYLGLFVSNMNGVMLTGTTDSSTLTYTLTAP